MRNENKFYFFTVNFPWLTTIKQRHGLHNLSRFVLFALFLLHSYNVIGEAIRI